MTPSEDAIRTACAEILALPSSQIHLVRIHEGEHDTWYLNKDLIVKSSQRPDGHSDLEIDMAVRRLLRGSLSESMATFVPSNVARTRVQGIGTMVIDSRVLGVSLEQAVPTVQTERDLVQFFKELQSIPIQDAMTFGLIRQDEEESFAGSSWTSMARLKDRNQLPSEVAVPSKADWLRARPTPKDLAVLSHSDLKGEHIFVHPDGSVAGLIDWADTTLASPSNDICGLCISIGTAMASRIGLVIGLSEEVVDYGIWKARYETTLRLDERLNEPSENSPVPLLEVQMRRAFERVEMFDHDAFS